MIHDAVVVDEDVTRRPHCLEVGPRVCQVKANVALQVVAVEIREVVEPLEDLAPASQRRVRIGDEFVKRLLRQRLDGTDDVSIVSA